MENRSTNPLEDTSFEESLLEFKDNFRSRILEVSLDKLTISTNEIEGTEETFDSTLSDAIVLAG